jgi:hypothetical protein
MEVLIEIVTAQIRTITHIILISTTINFQQRKHECQLFSF